MPSLRTASIIIYLTEIVNKLMQSHRVSLLLFTHICHLIARKVICLRVFIAYTCNTVLSLYLCSLTSIVLLVTRWSRIFFIYTPHTFDYLFSNLLFIHLYLYYFILYAYIDRISRYAKNLTYLIKTNICGHHVVDSIIYNCILILTNPLFLFEFTYSYYPMQYNVRL